jgi:hypothetical protein
MSTKNIGAKLITTRPAKPLHYRYKIARGVDADSTAAEATDLSAEGWEDCGFTADAEGYAILMRRAARGRST